MKAWISERVRQLVSSEDLTEIDAEGVSQYLPDELDDSDKGSPQEQESILDEPAPVLDMRIRSAPIVTPNYQPDTGIQDEPSQNDGEEGGPESTESTGEGGEGGADQGDGKGDHGDGMAGPEGPDHAKRIGLSNVRIYCSDPNGGRYRLLFEPQSGGAQHLRVFVIGEVGAESAPITKYSVNGSPDLPQSNNKGIIGPLSLPQGERAILEVVLKDSLRCALGVTAYAG